MKTKLLRKIRRVYLFEYHKLLDGDYLYCAGDYYRKRMVCELGSYSLAVRLCGRTFGKLKAFIYVIKRQMLHS
jgi:hypothetical protein